MRWALITALALSACGDSTVTVTGEVIVKHQVDVAQFEAYYKAYCETIYIRQVDIDNCVETSMADMLDMLANSSTL
jgi:predicted thioredoxin/glutaredoxin